MTPHEILIAARSKIDTPQKWCTGVLAKDHLGKSCAPGSESAVQYCAVGALRSFEKTSPLSRMQAFTLLNSACSIPIDHFNDRNEHADVMAVYDKAISIAKREG